MAQLISARYFAYKNWQHYAASEYYLEWLLLNKLAEIAYRKWFGSPKKNGEIITVGGNLVGIIDSFEFQDD